MADGSFEEFYDATYHRLLNQLILVTADRGDAEDLLQDAYGRAAARWRRLRDYQTPEAWVRRAAASQLNVPVGTVKSRLSRGRAALARRLTPGPEVVRNNRWPGTWVPAWSGSPTSWSAMP